MMIRWLAIAGLVAACGSSSSGPAPTPDAPASGGDPQPTVTYEGTLASVPAVAFGGAPFCPYTETVSNLVLDLLIKPSGAVTGGALQNHNVEACTDGMVTPQPPSDTSFTLAGAQASGTGMQLTFTGAASNRPNLSLTIQLTPANGAYSAAITLHRIDEPSAPTLEWTVTATVQLAPKVATP
jgi:hypothetical protein